MSAAAENKVIEALRAGAATKDDIRRATGLSAAEVKAGITRARFKGKILFDRLELSASMKAEQTDSAAGAGTLEPGAAAEGSHDPCEAGVGGAGVSASPASEPIPEIAAPDAADATDSPAIGCNAPGADEGAAATRQPVAAAPDIIETVASAPAEEADAAAAGGAPGADAGAAAFETGAAAPEPLSGAQLVAEVEVYLARTGTTRTRFSLGIASAPAFLNNLAKAKRLAPESVARVRAFMAAHPAGVPLEIAKRPSSAAKGNEGRAATAVAKQVLATAAPDKAETVAAAVKAEAEVAGARRQVARSTSGSRFDLAAPPPAARALDEPAGVRTLSEAAVLRRPQDAPAAPRRRIPLPSDLSLVETIQTGLAETPEDLQRAINRAHPETWRRVLRLGRAMEMRPGQALYAALNLGLDQLEHKEPAHDRHS